MECAVGDTAKAIIADGRFFCTDRKKIAWGNLTVIMEKKSRFVASQPIVAVTSNRFLTPVRLSLRWDQNKIESSPCATRKIIAEQSEPANMTNPDERK
jgi:hypothetical protein